MKQIQSYGLYITPNILSSKLADPAIVVASFVSLATAFLCFASKAISRSLRCPKGLALRRSSSPNQTRLRLGFDSVLLCPQNWLTLPETTAHPFGWAVVFIRMET